MPRTHYDNLKVSRDAPIEVIRASFRALSAKYHPDVNQQSDATRIFRIIKNSYDVLSDPVKRAEHDKWIVEQETSKEPPRKPPTNPLPPSFEDTPTMADKWMVGIGVGIVLAVVVAMIIFVSSDPAGRATNTVDSSVRPATIPENPQTAPAATVPESPLKPHTTKPKAASEPVETPLTANKYRFHKPFVYPPSRSEIDDVIKSGRYSALPRAEVMSPATGSGPSHLSIENQTVYTLTITFYASAQRSVKVSAGQTLELDVEPGTYRELCRASSPTVMPFVGNDSYAAGGAYKSTYYIVHQIVP